MRTVSRTNENGVSAVEALIAVAILATVAVFVAQFNQNFQPQNLGIRRTCQSHAQSILNSIQEETYYRQVVNFVPTSLVAASRRATSFSGGADAPTAAMRNPPLGNLWFTGPAAAFQISSNDPGVPDVNGVELQNFQLIQGTMRTLATIYNNVPAVRAATGGAYAPLTTNNPQMPWPNELATAGRNTQITLRIQPYNSQTGANIATVPIYPAPLGGAPAGAPVMGGDFNNGDQNALVSAFAPVRVGAPNIWIPTDPALPTGNEAYRPGGAAPASRSLPVGFRMANRGVGSPTTADVGGGNVSVGFEVTVNIQYDHEGDQENCSVTQKFEYPVDRTPPPPPRVQVITNPSYPPAAARPNCVANVVQGVQIQIQGGIVGALAVDQERGVQYLCRDLSWQKGWQPNDALFTQPPCIRGATIQPTEIQYNDDPALQNFSLRQNYWVPCDQVRQCGVAPLSAVYNSPNPNNVGAGQTLTLTYPPSTAFISADGLRTCVFNMEVVAVDTAGNTSIAGQVANRRFLEQVGAPAAAAQPITRLPPNGAGVSGGGVDRSNEYLHSACGVFCARNANWNKWGAAFPNGYWTCRPGGCCVDPGRGVPGDGLCRWNTP